MKLKKKISEISAKIDQIYKPKFQTEEEDNGSLIGIFLFAGRFSILLLREEKIFNSFEMKKYEEKNYYVMWTKL